MDEIFELLDLIRQEENLTKESKQIITKIKRKLRSYENTCHKIDMRNYNYLTRTLDGEDCNSVYAELWKL